MTQALPPGSPLSRRLPGPKSGPTLLGCPGWPPGSGPSPRSRLPPSGGWSPCSSSPCDFGEKAVPKGSETGDRRKGRRERQTADWGAELHPAFRIHLHQGDCQHSCTAYILIFFLPMVLASPSRMASGRARSTRKLRNWVLEQVESGQFPGVCWDDEDKTMFRIPWKHAGKQDFREEQDAAFFKAWAIFKGKYREGDQADPAAWKTRLRCALNKSSEFEEVPGRGHMEGPEPYKVYRLLPPGILPAPLGTQKLPPKRSHTALSSEDEDNGENKRTCMPSLPSQQNSARSMVAVPSKVPNSSFQHMDDSGIGSNSNSPQPHEVADSIEVISQEDLEMPPSLPDADYSLLLTFRYSGHLVGQTKVYSPDCRLVAKLSGSQSNMEQVVLPSASVLPEPTLQVATGHLLNLFDRGILVASNARGLFVQRLCTMPISWTGPCTLSGPGPHLLQDKACVEVFNPARFFQGLARYHEGLAPPPEFQVTLNFLEEHCDPGSTHNSLITVQMEQAFARHLLEETGFV
ncbi:interferon regulatory factor 9 isoform X2 [Monodelphis domestica]|uniref:interferon regulatory factor 9 isoform X2 n=2 Tax=Monodelphis domestica TaxID=13616 RepID=UPI0024E1F837|nr:interferon regulatory factor 9 isoform X2 [Monodelphis domestica]